MSICVAALYKFYPIDELDSLRADLKKLCASQHIKGTLILATEGINGTIAGLPDKVDSVLAHIRDRVGSERLEVKYSTAETMPFYRMKVMVKREIVTMGMDSIDPLASVGTYVEPKDWNALISDPETVVIDTRNDYEVGIGSFKGAIDPQTATFRDFPRWFRANRDALTSGKKRVAMFCTGGIRCEKSTAFLKQEGVDEVYHLQGGILKYLEEIPQAQSLWEGECFVFDQRVSVTHGLALGSYDRCHACRDPLSAADMASPLYVEGISCPKCHDKWDEARKARFAERQKQVELSQKRGKSHIGVDPRAHSLATDMAIPHQPAPPPDLPTGYHMRGRGGDRAGAVCFSKTVTEEND